MTRKPRLLAYTTHEGGGWNKWQPHYVPRMTVHSLLFSDGSIWDWLNGWRPRSSWYTQLRICQLRNSWRRTA